MKNQYRVRILNFSNILEIPDAWSTADFAVLLDVMEYGDQSGMGDEEIREMCILSLQDLRPVEAANTVLRYHMGDVLRDGQIRDLSHEMLDEKLWEEYSDSSLHERMFNVGSLLYAAQPGSFPEPDAVRIMLEITAANKKSGEMLTSSPDEPWLVRLLADGMDRQAVLHRLYGDQLQGRSFPNASEVIWISQTEESSDDVVRMMVISSGYWLDALNRTKTYDSAAYADRK